MSRYALDKCYSHSYRQERVPLSVKKARVPLSYGQARVPLKLQTNRVSRYARQGNMRVSAGGRACFVSYLVLVDDVRDAEEDGSGGHDERADHGVNEADDED